MIATVPAELVEPGDIITIGWADRLVFANHLEFMGYPLRRIAFQHGERIRFAHFHPHEPVTITGHKETT